MTPPTPDTERPPDEAMRTCEHGYPATGECSVCHVTDGLHVPVSSTCPRCPVVEHSAAVLDVPDIERPPPEELAAYVAAVEAGDDRTGKRQRLDEEIRSAAVVLGYTGRHQRARGLLDAWEAYAEPGEDVRALPPEPPVGTVVEVIGGTFAGERFTRVSEERLTRPANRWRARRSGHTSWPDILAVWAGPQGVRVVGEAP